MSYKRIARRYFGWIKNQRILALVCSGMILFLASPWGWWAPGLRDQTTLGMATGFFVMIIVAPIFAMFVLSFFLEFAEDNDRHDPELENE